MLRRSKSGEIAKRNKFLGECKLIFFSMSIEIAINFEAEKFRVTHNQFIRKFIITHLSAILGYDNCQNSYEGNQSQVATT